MTPKIPLVTSSTPTFVLRVLHVLRVLRACSHHSMYVNAQVLVEHKDRNVAGVTGDTTFLAE